MLDSLEEMMSEELNDEGSLSDLLPNWYDDYHDVGDAKNLVVSV